MASISPNKKRRRTRSTYDRREAFTSELKTLTGLAKRLNDALNDLAKDFDITSSDDQAADMSQWKAFYDLAKDFCNKNRDSNDDTILEQIEKKSPFSFPANDETIKAACNNLSEALQNAVISELKQDTDEVKQAVANLRNVYNEAAASNEVNVPCLHIEPPGAPLSPLVHSNLHGIVLARSWVKELIHMLADNPENDRVVVIGSPGTGEVLCLFSPFQFA
jgi:hypothetical protein